MKLSDHILRKPLHVAFGQAMTGGGITSVDLVATRDATTVTLTASDGSAAPIAGADASTAGVLTAADKTKLDSLPPAVAQEFAAGLDVAAAVIGAGITHLRTAGYAAAGDGGEALYKRAGVEPAHNLKVQSADLAWWEIVPTNNIIPFQACGGVEGDVAANGAANVTAFDDFIGYAQSSFATGWDVSGPVLLFPEGDYHFNDHLNVKAAVTLRGAGTYADGARTGAHLHFAANSNGIIVQAQDTIDETTEAATFNGKDSIIENLSLTGNGFGDTAGHGIWLRTRALIRNCSVIQFGLDGIHIVANVGSGGATEGNANTWRVEHCLVKRNGRHGLYVDDADANAGYAIGLNASLNARWGIFDSGFLGNTYLACHTQQNGVAGIAGNAADESSYVHFGGNRYSANAGASEAQLVATTPGTDQTIWILKGSGGAGTGVPLWTAAKPEGTYFHGGAYHTDNANAAHVFLGCYREDNQGENQVRAPSVIVSGLMGQNKATGYTIASFGTGTNIVGEHSFHNEKTHFLTSDPSRVLTLDVNPDDLKLLRINAGGSSGWMGLAGWDEGDDNFLIGEFNNSGGARPILITSGTTTLNCGRSGTLSGGQIVFGQGIFLGASRSTARHMTNGTGAPASGAHSRGEIVWNSNVVAGAALGWACVASGTPGTWVEMRGVANQTSGASQAALTNSTGGIGDGTIAAVGDTSISDQSGVINDNITELHTLLDEVRTTLVNFGLMKGGV